MFESLKYQQKLINDSSISNQEAQRVLFKAIKEGHQITHLGELEGPYTKHTTYFISDGAMVQLVEPASLHWVPIDRIGDFP